jgi:hypothetical protein
VPEPARPFVQPCAHVRLEVNQAAVRPSRRVRARQAGYTPNAIQRIISTPSDVSMFSRLAEANQRAILRQANDSEFQRYLPHAHAKIRAEMRNERSNSVPHCRTSLRRISGQFRPQPVAVMLIS